ncbi:flavin reductase [Marinobacterium aestuariivivens]|uniref:Flavin reductase n=1 Tax=Marinobacterium aestuariivivens TaxID=1698799 RepID=A0ABW2A8G5_9GAMM
MMEFDFTGLSKQEKYKLLVSFVVPRPIALVTSRCADGINNAAPISFFNVFSDEPPLLILGIQHKPGGYPRIRPAISSRPASSSSTWSTNRSRRR